MSFLKETSVDKLTDNNYSVWKFKLEQILIKEGLYEVVFEEKPEKVNDTWIKNDRNARAIISLNVSDSQIIHIIHAKTAKETWEQLKNVHERVNLTNKLFLLRKLYSIRYNESIRMQEHIKNVLELAEKLRSIGEEIKENNLIAILLCSLPNSYSNFITSIESKSEDELSLEYVKNKLIDEYTRRFETNQTQRKFDSMALKGNERHFKPKPQAKRYCKICEKNNHMTSECHYRRDTRAGIRGESNRFSFQQKTNKQNYASAVIEREKMNQKYKDKTRSEEKCSSKFFDNGIESRNQNSEFNSNESVLNARENEINYKLSEFIVDSGASSHMCYDINYFSELKKLNNQTVTIANGTKLIAKGIGEIHFEIKTLNGERGRIKLEDVLYVPSLDCNLLSVKSCTDKGCAVKFQDNIFTIKKGHKLIADGEENEGLYKLSIIPKNEKACVITEGITVCSNENCIMKWHQRLGHRSLDAIKRIQKDDLALGIKINNCSHDLDCPTCTRAKLTEKPYPKMAQHISENPLDLIHTDICGPMEVASLGGKRYFLTFIDDFSRYTQVYFLSSKDEVYEKLKEYIASTTNKFRMKIKTLRSDNGTEYCNKSVDQYLRELGIKHQTTVPYSPAQNGISERKNRSLIEMSKAMLINSELPKTFWAEAVATATYLQNRLPTKATEKTPYELWNCHKPNLNHLKVFGCKAYLYVNKQNRQKFDEKAIEGTFVGYDVRSKGYRIFTGGRKITISRTVKFSENQPSTNKEECKPDTRDQIKLNLLLTNHENEENIPENEEISGEQIVTEEADIEEEGNDETRRTSKRVTKGIPPERFSYKVKDSLKYPEPKSFDEIATLSETEQEKWHKAMNEEMKSLKENKVYEIVELPKGKRAIGCKWTYKAKQNEAGKVERYKARLVAKGFNQKYGLEYEETFAPVVKHTTIRSFLTTAVYKNMHVKHIDIKTAFLYGDLKEEIYMQQPKGYTEPENAGKVYKLQKAIYGLKQAARAWNEKIGEVLIHNNFVQSTSDPCLFTKKENGVDILIVLYVDDLLIGSKNEEKIDKVIEILEEKFDVKNLGEVNYYLGISIRRKQNGSFELNQKNKIEDLLEKFDINFKPTYIPMDTAYQKKEDESSLLENNTKYRQAVGALLYIATVTRPDILIAVNLLSRKNEKPSEMDWSAIEKVICYLNTTKNINLVFNSDIEQPTLTAYSDADWANDLATRKSTGGCIFFIGKNPISWISKRQNCVALSSAESEYVAAAEASMEIEWLNRLLKDLGLQQILPITLFEDNKSCIIISQNNKNNCRSKHIDVRYHYIRQLQSERIIQLEYCNTKNMIADILTKPLPRPQFIKLRNALNLVMLD